MTAIDAEGVFTGFKDFMKGCNVKYFDVRLVSEETSEVSCREGSFEFFSDRYRKIVCRAVEDCYGVACSSEVNREGLVKCMKHAFKLAREGKLKLKLASVKPQKGFNDRCSEESSPDEKIEVLKIIRDKLVELTGENYWRSEIIVTQGKYGHRLLTSEGTDVREKKTYTTILIYLTVKGLGGLGRGFSSKFIGVIGGLKKLLRQVDEHVLKEASMRSMDSMRGRSLPVSMKGKNRVILDSEAAAALAHEISHFLEKDVFQRVFFERVQVNDEFKLIDNPLLEEYGSFKWDDEGVKGREKTLISQGEFNTLGTRLTSDREDEAGNARGIYHVPKPMMSNIYINKGDWSFDELVEDTRKGVFVRGIVRAQSNLLTGNIELIPEISYLIEKKEIGRPIKSLRIIGNIKDILRNVDALTREVKFRASYEKGFPIAEGSPFIRVNEVNLP